MCVIHKKNTSTLGLSGQVGFKETGGHQQSETAFHAETLIDPVRSPGSGSSHLWAGARHYQLDTFDRIPRRAIRIVLDTMFRV